MLPAAALRSCRPARRHVLRALAVVTLLGVAGCQSAGEPRAIPSKQSTADRHVSTSPPVALPPPSDTRESTRILAAYRHFWSLAPTVSRQPPESWRTTLSRVATEPLLSQLLDGITEQYRKGLADYGTVRPRPRVVRVSSDRASVVDCQDASQSGTLDTETGIVKNVGSSRTSLASVLVRGPDDRWRMSEARLLEGSC